MRYSIRTFIFLLLTGIVSISIVCILYRRAGKINAADNDFLRFFPPHFITGFVASKLPFDLCYVAGYTDSAIYLGKYQSPMNVLKTNYAVSKIQSINLHYDSMRKVAWSLVKVEVDSPDTYIMEGLSPNIIRGNLNNPKNEQIVCSAFNFDICIPRFGQSILIKRFDLQTNSNILEKIVPGQNNHIRLILNPEPGPANMFTSDGMLNFDRRSGNTIFVYFHSNEFIRLDTNLKVLVKGKTIDTIAHPNIKIGYIASEHFTTYASPPLVVNRRSCITDRQLFVHSMLRANNQDHMQFSLSSTIDIYSLLDGRYLLSFYLPKYQKEEIIDFKVHRDKIVAIYHHYIVVYDMAMPNSAYSAKASFRDSARALRRP